MMPIEIIEETAATASTGSREVEEYAEAGTQPREEYFGDHRIARNGLLIATFVLSAALTSASAGPPLYYSPKRREDTVAENSTEATECDPKLLSEVRDLFERGASEFFEDGMHSVFSRALLALLANHGRAGFQAIVEYLFSEVAAPDVVSEALRWLSDFGDPATLRERWNILERSLRSRTPRVRDGAILGFAALDDPRARTLLSEAKNSERIAELRQLIDQVVQQLDTTANAATASRRPAKQMA